LDIIALHNDFPYLQNIGMLLNMELKGVIRPLPGKIIQYKSYQSSVFLFKQRLKTVSDALNVIPMPVHRKNICVFSRSSIFLAL
jgi:hypothetical protein